MQVLFYYCKIFFRTDLCIQLEKTSLWITWFERRMRICFQRIQSRRSRCSLSGSNEYDHFLGLRCYLRLRHHWSPPLCSYSFLRLARLQRWWFCRHRCCRLRPCFYFCFCWPRCSVASRCGSCFCPTGWQRLWESPACLTVLFLSASHVWPSGQPSSQHCDAGQHRLFLWPSL